MITYTISDWTIDGDEAHAHIIGKNEDGEHVEEVTLSRAHDAPGWTIEGREGEVYDTPNHAPSNNSNMKRPLTMKMKTIGQGTSMSRSSLTGARRRFSP